jgi:deoxycytidine triphosphate deaminase
MAVLYPRSSTNRKGLSLDLTGIIDAGYEGQLLLPVRNNTRSQTVRLYPGERLCQIVFEELKHSVDDQRLSKYHQKDIIEGVGMEKKTEVDLLMSGDIKKLKSEHNVLKE